MSIIIVTKFATCSLMIMVATCRQRRLRKHPSSHQIIKWWKDLMVLQSQLVMGVMRMSREVLQMCCHKGFLNVIPSLKRSYWQIFFRINLWSYIYYYFFLLTSESEGKDSSDGSNKNNVRRVCILFWCFIISALKPQNFNLKFLGFPALSYSGESSLTRYCYRYVIFSVQLLKVQKNSWRASAKFRATSLWLLCQEYGWLDYTIPSTFFSTVIQSILWSDLMLPVV